MDLSNDSNAPRGEDTSTPTSHWVAPHVWWADTDDNIEVNLNSAISPLPPPWDNTRRPSSQAVVGNGPSPRLQHMHRDPRGIFGDLPNSSFNGALTDPVERELRRRSAAVQEREATTPVSSDPPKQKINEDGITFDVEQQVGEGAGVVTARTGTAVDVVDIGSWREECHRLQGELANLARQRDRWEQQRAQHRDMDTDHARELTGLKRAVEAQSQLVMESLVTTQRLVAGGASMMMAAAEGYNIAPFQQPRYPHPASPWVHPNPPPGRTSSNAFKTTRSPAVALARRRLEIASESTHNRTSFQDLTTDDQSAEKTHDSHNKDEGEQIPLVGRTDRDHHHGRSNVSTLFNRRYQRESGGSRRQHQAINRELTSQRSVAPQTLGYTPDAEVENKSVRNERERERKREEERARRRWPAAHYENDRSLAVDGQRAPSRKHEQSRPSHYWPTSADVHGDSSPPASAHAGSLTRRFPETVQGGRASPPTEEDWRRWGKLYGEHFIINKQNKDAVEHCDNNDGEEDGISGRGVSTQNALRTAADIDAAPSQQTPLRGEHYSTHDRQVASHWQQQRQRQRQQQPFYDQRYLSPYAIAGNGSRLYMPASKQEQEAQQQQEHQRQRRLQTNTQQGVNNSTNSRVYNDRGKGRWKKLDSSDSGRKEEVKGEDGDGADEGGRSSGATEEVWEWRGRKVMLIQPVSKSSSLEKTSRLEMQQEGETFNSERVNGTGAEAQGRLTPAIKSAMNAGTANGVTVEASATVNDPVALIDELKQVREAIHALAGKDSDRRRVSFALHQEAGATPSPLPTAAATPMVTPLTISEEIGNISAMTRLSPAATVGHHQHGEHDQVPLKPSDGEQRSSSLGSSSSSPCRPPPTASSSTSVGLHQPAPSASTSSLESSASVDNNTSATTIALEHEPKHGPTPSRRPSSVGSSGVDDDISSSPPSSACPAPSAPNPNSSLRAEDDSSVRRHTGSSVERDVEKIRSSSNIFEPSVVSVSAAATGDGDDDQRVSDEAVNEQEGQDAEALVGDVEKDIHFNDAHGQEGQSVQETRNLAEAGVDRHFLTPDDEVSGHDEAEEMSGNAGMTTVDGAHHAAEDAVGNKHNDRHFVACCPG